MKTTEKFLLLLAALTPAFIAFAPRGMAALLVLFTLVAVAATVLGKIKLPPLPRRPLLACGAALALVAASTAWSESPRAFEMLRDVSYVTICTFVLFHLSYSWTTTHIQELHRVMLACFIGFLALFSINLLADFPLQYLTGNIPDDGRSIFESNIPKRSAALFVIFMWPLALGLWLTGKKHAAALLLLITSALSLLFNSSTAMLGAFAGLLVLAIGQWRVRAAQSIGLAALPLGFVLMMALAMSVPNLPPHLTEHVKDTGDYRLQIWNFVARHTFEHMPFGIGIDGSRVLPSNGENVEFVAPDAIAQTTVYTADILPDHPHNVYLQIWLELGIPGVLLAILLTAMLWRRIYVAPRALQPFLWGYVVTASITLAIAYGAWQAWWLAGHGLCAIMLAAISRTYKEEA